MSRYKMEFSEYRELAKKIQEHRKNMGELFKFVSGKFPKPIIRELMSSQNSLDNFKSMAEDRMYKEYPEVGNLGIYLFYPSTCKEVQDEAERRFDALSGGKFKGTFGTEIAKLRLMNGIGFRSAKKLFDNGITTHQEFMNASDIEIGKILGKKPKTIAKMRFVIKRAKQENPLKFM